MNSIAIVIGLFCLLSLTIADDISVTPTSLLGYDGTPEQVSVNVKNIASPSTTLYNVSYTVATSDSGCAIYYTPLSATKATVGAIASGATGQANFNFVASANDYTLTFWVTYRKGTTYYLKNFTCDLQVLIDGPPPSGKREMAELAAAEDEVVMVYGRTADLAINPTGWNTYDGTSTWVGMSITAGSTTINNVSYTVVPDDQSVIIVYLSGGTGMGTITANNYKTTSFQITGGAGEYYLNVTVKYRKSGITYLYLSQVNTLEILIDEGTTAGRSAFGKTLGLDTSTFNMSHVIAAAVGVAAFAGVAIVGVALFLRKRAQPVISAELAL